MTKIRLTQLIWDEWNVVYIKKHKVAIKEAEEAISSIVTHRAGYDGRIILIGRSGKRLLALIMSPEEKKKYYIVTARDADRKERRLVYERNK